MPDQPPYTWPPPYLPTPADYNVLEHYKRWGVQPPAFQYVTVEDVIVLRVISPLQSATVNVSVRLQTPDGRVTSNFWTFTALATGATPTTFKLERVEGFVLSASIETPSTFRGITFCSLELIRGEGSGDATSGATLVAGYPGFGSRISYPTTPVASPADGRGAMESFSPAAPGAGVDWAFGPLGNLHQIMRTIRARLVTSATVANRLVHLRILDAGGNIVCDVPPAFTQVASTTISYSWFPSAQAVQSDSSVSAPVPVEMRLAPSWSVATATTGIQAADQWSQIFLAMETFAQT